MKLRSKKAQDFLPMLMVIGFIVIFTMLFIAVLSLKSKYPDIPGEKQANAIQLSAKAEKALVFIDGSARQAAYQSSYELARAGGFLNGNKCQSILGFPLWQSELQDCFPTNQDVFLNYKDLFNKNLNLFLKAYGEIPLPQDNYDITLLKSQDAASTGIVGTALENIFLPYKPTKNIDASKDKIFPFDRYEIEVFGNVRCQPSFLQSMVFGLLNGARGFENDVAMKDFFTTDGEKYIYADVLYNSRNSFSQVSFTDSKRSDFLTRYDQIDRGLDITGKFCPADQVNPLYNIRLTTFKEGKQVCSISSIESDQFSGNDLKTWGNNEADNNGDGKIDTSCFDSPTVLQCPGLTLFYCGKLGPGSSADKYSDAQVITSSGKDYIDSNFILSNSVDKAADGLPIGKVIHSKTASKFQIVFDPDQNATAKYFRRDTSWERYVSGKWDYIVSVFSQPSNFGEKYRGIFYSIKPSFDVKINYSFGDYAYLVNSSKNLLENVSSCEKKDTLLNCVSAELKQLSLNGYNWGSESDCPGYTPKKDPRILFFCVANNNQLIPAYDPVDNLVKYRNPVYNFALYMRPPVQTVEGLNYKPLPDTGCALFSWKKPTKVPDNYTLFYADFDLNGNQVINGDVTNGTALAQKKEIKIQTILYDSFDPLCVFHAVGSPCSHSYKAGSDTNYLSLQDNTLIESNGIYYYKVCGLEEKQYFAGLIAGSQIAIDSSVSFIPSDILAPSKVDFTTSQSANAINVSFSKPAKNIDSSDLSNDLSQYLVFAKKSDCSNIVDISYLVARPKPDDTSLQIQQVESAPVSTGSYCVAMIAIDSSNNPLSIKELSATEKTLEIKPEYSQIINLLSSPQTITIP